jgi:outer membrane protein assembly factor BamB
MFWQNSLLGSVWAWLTIALASPAGAIEVEQVISRESPAFQPSQARLTLGRDGRVYLCSGAPDRQSAFVLCLRRDGSDKIGGSIAYFSTRNVTANADGVMAAAASHSNHKVALYNRKFEEIAAYDQFLANDQVGFGSPRHVEAGDSSGDFYALDDYLGQQVQKIVRFNPAGKAVQTYLLPPLAKNEKSRPEFRVCEKVKAFYVLGDSVSAPIQCIGFDGKLRWTYNAGIGFYDDAIRGGFDVDNDGNLYTIGMYDARVQKISPEGKLLATFALQMEGSQPVAAEAGFHDLRIAGGEVVLRRKHPTELFQVYDLESGKRKHVASIAYEKLAVSFPERVWTAGREVPFAIRLSASDRPVRPQWHVWAQPIGAAATRELSWQDGRLQVPADAAGVYQILVTPTLQLPDPIVVDGQPGHDLEYRLRTWVEIRQPNTKGSVSVWTENNQTHFANGALGPVSILVRQDKGKEPVPVTLELADAKQVFVRGEVKVRANDKPVKVELPAALRGRLRPGWYTLRATAAELSSVPQLVWFGPADGAAHAPSLRSLQFGDYTYTFPTADSGRFPDAWDAPAAAARHLRRTTQLGMDLMVDRIVRLGGEDLLTPQLFRNDLSAVRKHLEADPLAAAPQKVDVAPLLQQVLAGYDAAGIEQMSILMHNDAELPLASGYDPRKPEELLAVITRVTEALKGHPSFRGWQWAANWWVHPTWHGVGAARTPEEKAAYETALKRARETGAWDPVLERVSERRLGMAAEAHQLFNRKLRTLAPKLKTASACPYRNVDSYPPLTLKDVDEVDLQAQWEQVPPPYYAPYGPDFYKRPGKPAWFHPELPNDFGSGDQILSTSFQALMRGADSIGFANLVPGWDPQLRRPPISGDPRSNFPIADDPRSGYAGKASVHRALAAALRPYAPWLFRLQPRDRVALVVSGRMLRIDDWKHDTGTHFARLLEAYASCLHAHHPARCVFVEDLKPDTLTAFQAVLVVGQTVEMEPILAEALKRAQAKGVAVFYDGTCRASLVEGFTPLGIAFDKFEKDPHWAGEDAAYWRFPRYCRSNLPALKRALDKVATPPAVLDNDEVFVSERGERAGRFLFVVNNHTVPLEPGQLWRMTLKIASLVPMQVPVKMAADGQAVYDVFAAKPLQPKEGVIVADLRNLPARLFAILPRPIHQVELRGPQGPIEAGQSFRYAVAILDADGKPIDASLPVRVRLLDGKGRVLQERFQAAVPGEQQEQDWNLAWNDPSGERTLEATELVSRKTARLSFQVLPTKLPKSLTLAEGKSQAPTAIRIAGSEVTKDFLASEEHFGPHVKDAVVIGDGKQVVLNTMNWDHNLYALDTETGQVNWRQRIEQYFAFAPQAIPGGLAVQGFNFQTAEGYYLNLLDAQGKVQGRFPLYGLPRRLPHRFVSSWLCDRINQFAVAPDGSWIASAGDLGLVVWDRSGKRLWSQDWWKTQRRRTVLLAAISTRELLLVDDLKATIYEASNGTQVRQITVAKSGEMRSFRISSDGKTWAFLTTTDGGRVFVFRDGQPMAVFPTAGADLALTADGTHLAVTTRNLLRFYSVQDGLQWVLSGDDTLYVPRFSADGRRLAVSSSLGTVYVVGLDGSIQLERDFGALAVPAWLPEGDLLLATWMGAVVRLDGKYTERWRTHLEPAQSNPSDKLLPKPALAAAPLPRWGNAEPTPAPRKPNLLSPQTVRFEFRSGRPTDTSLQLVEMVGDPAMLTDGKTDPPAQPLLPWGNIAWFAEAAPYNYLQFDTFRTQLRVSGITLVEDPAHPESWLRDAEFDYWDEARHAWVPVQTLLSDAPIHTHKFARPVEGRRFRLVMPFGLVGNLRLAEIVLHGEVLGSSHPDVRARRPVAVLFDEGDELKKWDARPTELGEPLQFSGAYSGNCCLVLKTEGSLFPEGKPPFGSALPNWDFEITERPEPGQYRYLQFACKATGPETRGLAMRIGSVPSPQISFYVGEVPPSLSDPNSKKIADAVSQQWQVLRVDLWKMFQRPVRVQMMELFTKGGGAAFDQILLARSENDLPPLKK